MSVSWAQTNWLPRTLHIKKAKGKITLDGVLNEPDWQSAQVAAKFIDNFPYDTLRAKTKTVVRMTYDNKNIYVGAICYDSLPGNYVVQSLKRDFSYPINDAFVVTIDPFDDKTNGFSFGVDPMGVQRDGLISEGGGWGVTTSWDNIWYSKVKRYPHKWVVEMAIPFKSIRYRSNVKQWGINFSRNNLKRNENSCWSCVPSDYNIASLAFTGKLIWDTPPKKSGHNISLIPYAITRADQDYATENHPNIKPNIGLDAKVAVTSSLNLDLTINPDFSQVEVDQQVTNLTRYSLFFPERRNFFIENSDLFAGFGFSQIRPFFSRKIGLYDGEVIPIIGGARLSGKVNKNWRIGLMSIQTAPKSDLNLPGQNYSVAAVQRRVFKRSNIAAIFVNRQGFDNNEISYSDFNRIAGMDFNFASNNDKWQGKLFYHQSINPHQPKNSYADASFLMYNSHHWFIMWNHEYVGNNYKADIGFVPHMYEYNPLTGMTETHTYWRLEPEISYKFYPHSSIINHHGPDAYLSQYYDSTFQTTEYLQRYSYNVSFQNSSSCDVNVYNNFTLLKYPTDITFTGKSPVPSGKYNYMNYSVDYNSNKIHRLYGSATVDYGEYYNGKKLSFSGEIDYRQQPWGVFSMAFSRDAIFLPKPYSDAYLTLIGPKVQLSFTRNLFFSTFLQYNTQINNININSRLQWQFKPLSNIYLVYTDNYDAINFGKKNRALVLKFVYWLNI